MKRKTLLGVFAAAVVGLLNRGRMSHAQEVPRIDAGRAYEKNSIKEMFNSDGTNISEFDFSDFPFEHIETDGLSALAEFERLKANGEGLPVILGTDDDVGHIVGGWEEGKAPDAGKILQRAAGLGTDFDITAFRKRENDAIVAQLREQGIGAGLEDEEDPSMESGEWPVQVDAIRAPTVTSDVLSGEPHKRIHIALIPAKSAADIPAFLGWGGWNSNPPAEVHVVMFRRWQAKYGAELVGMTGDVLNFKVATRPTSKEEAMTLAREMYQYCADIVEQGTNDIETLAAILMVSDYWYFWWD